MAPHYLAFVASACLLVAAGLNPEYSMTKYEAARSKGQGSAERTGHGLRSGCWSEAQEILESSGQSCENLDDASKSLFALSLTRCHLFDRTGEFDAIACDVERAAHLLENGRLKDVKLHVSQCKASLTDVAFMVFTEFFNHADNVCFFVESQIWQLQTEATINNLARTSVQVVANLDLASRQNERLLMQQQDSLKSQEQLMVGSLRLQGSIDDGRFAISNAFDDIRTEVKTEHERLQVTFREIFGIFGRILDFQRAIAGQLKDFNTLVLYSSCVILTHFLTSSDATRRARVRLYALWSLMAIGESLLWRWKVDVFGPYETEIIIRWWRFGCLSSGVILWIITWWRWEDPNQICLRAIEGRMSIMQRELNDAMASEIRRALTECCTPRSYQRSLAASPSPEAPPFEPEAQTPLVGTLLRSDTHSQNKSPKSRSRTPRRTPPRPPALRVLMEAESDGSPANLMTQQSRPRSRKAATPRAARQRQTPKSEAAADLMYDFPRTPVGERRSARLANKRS